MLKMYISAENSIFPIYDKPTLVMAFLLDKT